MALTYNIQSVVHCRKFSMKQNVDIVLKQATVNTNWLLYYCCLFSIQTTRKMHDFRGYFSRTFRDVKPYFPGLSRSGNFQEKILGLSRRHGRSGWRTVITVAHAEDDLGRPVVTRHDVRSHHETCAGRASQTKVQDLERTVALHDNVGRLQVLQQRHQLYHRLHYWLLHRLHRTHSTKFSSPGDPAVPVWQISFPRMHIFETSLEDFPRKILGKCAFSKILWKDFKEKFWNVCRKTLTLCYKSKLRNNNEIFTKTRHFDT